MRVTVLSHNLSANTVMRAHRLAEAARTFADVKLLGPVERDGPYPALPEASWIETVPKRRFPEFFDGFSRLVEAADGDVLVAVKPHLASFGPALVAGEVRSTPVILDLEDLDIAFTPRSQWAESTTATDLSRPGAAVYISLLTKAAPAAAHITVSSTALQRRFGGTVIEHGADVSLFDPAAVDRGAARRGAGFEGPTVLFPGIPRRHKGFRELSAAVSAVDGACLAVTCRPKDLTEPEWKRFPIRKVPLLPYAELPQLLAASDLVAIPQLDTESSRYQMPAKVYDAMAMAKPIVASAISDLPRVLEGCGELVAPGDVSELTNAIRRLLDDPEHARELGERARIRCVENYSTEALGRKLQEVITRTAR